MSAVSEGPIPFDHVSQEENSSDPVDAVIFFGISLVLGIASRHLLRGTRVPYTVALLVLGVALGSIEYGTNHGLGRVGDGIRIWANINPDLLLAVFLPALLFESSFAMEVHQIKRCMVQMLLLAGPGVLISTFCLGTAVKFAFPYNWDWKTSLLLGGLLSATDPVAVVALLKELGASKKLSTIIEGESLMNDGTAIVVFQLFYKMVLGRSFTAGAILKFLTQVSLGAVAVGLAFGLTSVLWLGFIFNDTVIEIALTLAVSYLAYFTAQDGADVSGVLTVMTLGMFYAAVARTAFKGDSQQSLHHFWEMVSYIANTVIFILSGVVIAEGVLHSDNHFQNSGTSWVNLILLYVLVQASRIIVVGTLYPSLRYFGYGLDWKEAIILIWSGLRGAVALSLSLSVKDLRMGQRIGGDTMIVTTMVIDTLGLKRMESKVLQTGVVDENKVVLYCCCIIVLAMHQYNVFGICLFCLFKIKMRASDKSSSSNLNQEMGTLFVFFTGGIVFLTLIINGSTTQFILHFLSMDKLSDAKMRILDYTRYEMLNKAMEAFGDLGDDEELGPADWPTVKRYITCLNGLEGRQVHPHNVVESENHLHAMNLKDMRVRLLNGVQAAYWGMLDEGRINQSTAILLMQSVDEAIDLVVDEPLCDWKGLKSHVHFPSYYKFLQMSFCPPKLVTYFTVERLESSCYICAAFLRAHRIATRQLHEFIGESEIASIVINESGMEGEEARKFLEDVRVTFPQVLRVVKTRQATYSILKHLSDYVQNLEKAGLLEEKEMFQLHEGVQMDLKKLLRNPPLVKMPKLRDMLSIHPFLGALPSIFREPIEASIKQIMKLRGVALYKEGSKPNGIWLISNGVVKWSSKSLRNRHSLHPTFSHGSTLGLYEVLIGKPFICDVITDSAVHCFFIDAEKILSILRSDSAVEEFLWQESVVTIAKLLLPQTFEEMAMQELRTLIAERSTMKIFISGEIIEIHQHVIGFILEGFVRTQGSQEVLITSPAALVPSHEDLGVQNSVTSGIKTHSFCHQGTYYQVETRTRVIFFDMGLFDAPGALQRKSSSLVSHSVDLPKFLNRDHGGLMSWPEHFYKRQHHPDGIDSQVDSLFARATQLSIFGSMVSDTRRHNRSWTCHTKPSHSLSYPRISSWKAHSRPLVSVRSEGTTINNSTKMRGFIEKKPISTLPSSRKEDRVHDDSSEEDECIVRIDSPSRLSFRR